MVQRTVIDSSVMPAEELVLTHEGFFINSFCRGCDIVAELSRKNEKLSSNVLVTIQPGGEDSPEYFIQTYKSRLELANLDDFPDWLSAARFRHD